MTAGIESNDPEMGPEPILRNHEKCHAPYLTQQVELSFRAARERRHSQALETSSFTYLQLENGLLSLLFHTHLHQML